MTGKYMSDPLFDELKSALGVMPFVLMVGGKPKMNWPRIMEAIISAAVIGGMIYGTFSTKLEYLEKSMTEIKQDMRDLKHDLYTPNGKKP